MDHWHVSGCIQRAGATEQTDAIFGLASKLRWAHLSEFVLVLVGSIRRRRGPIVCVRRRANDNILDFYLCTNTQLESWQPVAQLPSAPLKTASASMRSSSNTETAPLWNKQTNSNNSNTVVNVVARASVCPFVHSSTCCFY